MSGLRIAFFGSSIVSSYWNGACTYYRGIVRALHRRGHDVTFYEPDAFDRQRHRDIADPPWARVIVWEPGSAAAARLVVASAGQADVVVKCSGVGVFDDVLERAVAELDGPLARVFWDVDAPATLARMEADPDDRLRALIPTYDAVLTYGGGRPVTERYAELGARRCVPVYNAVDPDTHHPVPARSEFEADLSFLGNRLPDREARVEEFFFGALERSPGRRFLLGGNGWEDRAQSALGSGAALRYLGHVPTTDHNALNCSALAVLNVSRESMAVNGWSPATRVFEAAGAAACLITDAWEGIEDFLSPGEEVLVAHDGGEVAAQLAELDPPRAVAIGRAARERVLSEHTYARRAALVEEVLDVAVGVETRLR
jgi:spore maturation protein CgeB